MFSSWRRRSKKPQDRGGPPFIRTSPSLPELSSQGIPWPEDFVDVSDLPPPTPISATGLGKPIENPAGGRISHLYMSPPPSAFNNHKSNYTRQKPSQKRNRNITTFNIMVAGAQGTGKTSLLRLLLETAEISPTATAEQRAAAERFLHGMPRRTEGINVASVEICETKYDRMLLSVIDTPGLDFQDGHELKLERQVSAIVKYMDEQFADTLSEESKVVRQSKGDQHVHLCIYAIDPASVISSAERRDLSFKPGKVHPSTSMPPLSTSSTTSSEMTEDEYSEEASMRPADIAVMRRLMKKTNLLPIIARADSLTNDKLDAIKQVIRRDLKATGLDFGVFGPIAVSKETNGNGADHGENGHPNDSAQDEEDSEPEEERKPRAVIKLRTSRNPFKRFTSRSRSRVDLTENADEPSTADINDNESVASVRFSAKIVAKGDLSDTMPFALIAPEYSAKRKPRRVPRPISGDRQSFQTDAGTSVAPSDDGHGPASVMSSAGSLASKNAPYLAGPPEDLKGVFVRKFRWGTIDVLSPEHCDFAALRTAVLSTHMKMLKIRTKEVLYEKFRTEKLLARRATRNISIDEQRRMFEEIGL